MGVAAWLVWRERAAPGRRDALVLLGAHLAVNARWRWLFFAWKRGGLAPADIVLVAATIAAFRRIRPLAGALLLPFLGWIVFATALACRVWQDNPALLG